MNPVGFADIIEAKIRIADFVKQTPVLSSENINSIAGCEIFFKCENFQKVGAFKYRGATNAIRKLSESDAQAGVATHSSGNHAQALALAAKKRGIKAYIVMPKNAPIVKINAVKSYGADIIFCEPTLEARESTLNDVVKKTGATFIHPYNNNDVIAGQGTAFLELIEEVADLEIIMTPVGGGGLLSGTALATKYAFPDIKVIAAEPEGANDAYRSFYGREFVESINPKTVCDGLLTSLGSITYPIIKNNVDKIITANDSQIIEAMKLTWERMKMIIEPSSAVPLACILNNKEEFAGKKVGIIISGGNVDLNKLPW